MLFFLRENSLKLVNDEIVRTGLSGAIKGKEVDRINKAFDIVNEANTWRCFLFSIFLAKQKHSQGLLFIKLFFSFLEIQIVGAIVHLFSLDGSLRREIAGDMNLLSNFLNGVNCNLRMEYIRGSIYRSNSTKSLRDVSNAIVHIQIRYFSINST